MQSILKTVSGFIRKRSTDASPVKITMLCVLEGTLDRSVVDGVSKRNQWEVLHAATIDEARRLADRHRPQVILFDRDVAGVNWRYVVSALASASGGGCVLLISRVVDDYLWNEVVSNSGYDILRKPLGEEELVRNIRLASSYFHGVRQAAAAKK